MPSQRYSNGPSNGAAIIDGLDGDNPNRGVSGTVDQWLGASGLAAGTVPVGLAANWAETSSSPTTLAAHLAMDAPFIDRYYLPTDPDHTAAFQRAAASGRKQFRLRDTVTYQIHDTVDFPIGCGFVGQGRGAKIIPVAGGTFTGGWMFRCNTTDGATWVQSYPGMQSGTFANVFLDNTNGGSPIAGMRGFLAFGSYEFAELKFSYFKQSIKRPTGLYTDSFVAHRIFVPYVIDNDEYQVDLGGLGDGSRVSECHFPYDVGNSRSTLGVRVRGSSGSVISNLIGGDHITYEAAVSIRDCHLEQGQMIIDSSSVALSQMHFFPTTRVPLIFQATDAQRFASSLTDSMFWWLQGKFEGTQREVQISADHRLSVRNTFRRWSKDGGIDKSQLFGIRMQDSVPAAMTGWNNFSYTLSVEGMVASSNKVEPPRPVHQIDGTFGGISAIAADSATTWGGSTTTYYYRAIVLYDPVRLIGRAGAAEVSLALTAAGSGARLTISFLTKNSAGKVRVYRGTSAASYDKYVDVDMISSTLLYDDGTNLCGHAWVTRGAADIDTINGSIADSFIRWEGPNVVVRSSALPSAGTWVLGDRIERNNATVDGSNMLLFGNYRLTSGSGHNTSTDWASMRTSVVSPAT